MPSWVSFEVESDLLSALVKVVHDYDTYDKWFGLTTSHPNSFTSSDSLFSNEWFFHWNSVTILTARLEDGAFMLDLNSQDLRLLEWFGTDFQFVRSIRSKLASEGYPTDEVVLTPLASDMGELSTSSLGLYARACAEARLKQVFAFRDLVEPFLKDLSTIFSRFGFELVYSPNNEIIMCTVSDKTFKLKNLFQFVFTDEVYRSLRNVETIEELLDKLNQLCEVSRFGGLYGVLPIGSPLVSTRELSLDNRF